jgi:prophage DNA circulation protein
MVDLVSELAQSLVTASQIPEATLIGFKTAVGERAPFRALVSLFDFDAGDRPEAGTQSAQDERDSYDAFQQLVQRTALITASEAVLSEQFDSYDAALEAREQIVTRIDLHLETVADDTFEAFTDLRAALVAALPGEASDLPRLVEVTPPSTVASLVLAHRLYGSVDLEDDIVRRNNIRNPALILGGRTLQVLSNG